MTTEPIAICLSSDEEEAPLSKKQRLCEDDSLNTKENNENESANEELNDQEDENVRRIMLGFEGSKEIQEMLKLCYEKIKTEKTRSTFMDKVKLLEKHYSRVGLDYTQSEDFKNEMQRRIDMCKNSKWTVALQMFVELFKDLETVSKRLDESNGNVRAIRKLEKFLKKIHKKITELEEAEVNFDEEENSSYLQLQKYKERAVKVYKKLCEYRKENPHAGDITKQKIDFSASEFTEINRAINKSFRDGSKFPTYCDVEKCVRKCIKKHNMPMKENEIKNEARSCFEKLGNLLQNRRKLDLLNMHSSYLKTHQDPALKDLQLNEKLNEHKKEASKAITNICLKYVKMQEEGKEVELSEDSDDSNYETSEEDDAEK